MQGWEICHHQLRLITQSGTFLKCITECSKMQWNVVANLEVSNESWEIQKKVKVISESCQENREMEER